VVLQALSALTRLLRTESSDDERASDAASVCDATSEAARFAEAAAACARGLRSLLLQGSQLMHAIGSSRPADLLSHARVCTGLVQYYEASGDVAALGSAHELSASMLERFFDQKAERFYEPPDPILSRALSSASASASTSASASASASASEAVAAGAYSAGAAAAVLACSRLALHTPAHRALQHAVSAAVRHAPPKALVDAHTAVRWAVARRSTLLSPMVHVSVVSAEGEVGAAAAAALEAARRMREAVVHHPRFSPEGPSPAAVEAWQESPAHPSPAKGARAFPCVGERCMPPAAQPAALSATLDSLLWRAVDVDSAEDREVEAMGVLQALKAGDSAALARALVQNPQGAHRVDQQGRTPLIYAAVMGDDSATSLLLSHGVEVNAVATDGLTALHHAAIAGEVGVCELLCRHGADVGARSGGMRMKLGGAIPLSLPSGKTALDLASDDEVQRVLERAAAARSASI